jgi:hypothetical protein
MVHKITLISLLLLIAISSTAQQAKIKSDESINLADFGTFHVMKGDVVLITKRPLQDSVVTSHIRTAIHDEMVGRGYKSESDTTVALLLVDFIGEVLEKMAEGQVGPLGQQPADDAAQMNQSQTWSQVQNETSLSIVIYENKSRKKLWESSLNLTTASADIEMVLRSAVARSMKKIPKRKK